MKLNFWAFVSSALLAACQPQSTFRDSNSRLKHDLGRAVNDTSPYQWYELTEAQYETAVVAPFVQQVMGGSSAKVVPTDAPLTLRLQYWVDQIDAMLRLRDPGSLANVPKPKVRVVQTQERNAFVAPVFLCMNLPVVLEGAAQNQGNTEGEALIYVRRDKAMGMVGRDLVSRCLYPDWSRDQQVAALQWQFSNIPSCQLTDDGKTLTLSRECITPKTEPQILAKAKRVMVLATANYVTVLGGYTGELSEEEMVGTMAHELGHYYMSHPNAGEGTYNYFYWASETSGATKPQADATAQPLGEELLAMGAQGLFFGESMFRTLADQRYHTALIYPTAMLARLLTVQQCGLNPLCQSPCRNLFGQVSMNRDALIRLSMPPASGPLSAEDMEFYTAWETTADACLSQIKMDGTIGAIDFGTVADVFAGQSPLWLEIIKPSTSATTLGELWLEYSAQFRELEKTVPAKWRDLNNRAVQLGLGHYTDEQEADELAVEWMAAIGLDPQAAVSKWLDFASRDEDAGFMMVQSQEALPLRCEQAANLEWRDNAGQPLNISMGSLSDSHHAACYRAFNMSREIKVHGLTVSLPAQQQRAAVLPKETAPSWEELTAAFRP